MEALHDADAGSWIRPLLDPRARDMHCVVPHGYAAYARVFHPATRDRPVRSASWRRQDRSGFVDVETGPVPWATVAQTFGTPMHALAQFHRLPGPPSEPYGEVLDAGHGRRRRLGGMGRPHEFLRLQPADLPLGRCRDNFRNSVSG